MVRIEKRPETLPERCEGRLGPGRLTEHREELIPPVPGRLRPQEGVEPLRVLQVERLHLLPRPKAAPFHREEPVRGKLLHGAEKRLLLLHIILDLRDSPGPAAETELSATPVVGGGRVRVGESL